NAGSCSITAVSLGSKSVSPSRRNNVALSAKRRRSTTRCCPPSRLKVTHGKATYRQFGAVVGARSAWRRMAAAPPFQADDDSHRTSDERRDRRAEPKRLLDDWSEQNAAPRERRHEDRCHQAPNDQGYADEDCGRPVPSRHAQKCTPAAGQRRRP